MMKESDFHNRMCAKVNKEIQPDNEVVVYGKCETCLRMRSHSSTWGPSFHGHHSPQSTGDDD